MFSFHQPVLPFIAYQLHSKQLVKHDGYIAEISYFDGKTLLAVKEFGDCCPLIHSLRQFEQTVGMDNARKIFLLRRTEFAAKRGGFFLLRIHRAGNEQMPVYHFEAFFLRQWGSPCKLPE